MTAHRDDHTLLTFRLGRVLNAHRRNRRLLNEFPPVLPSLVHTVADWLNEHDQYEAAELVRLEANRTDWLINP